LKLLFEPFESGPRSGNNAHVTNQSTCVGCLHHPQHTVVLPPLPFSHALLPPAPALPHYKPSRKTQTVACREPAAQAHVLRLASWVCVRVCTHFPEKARRVHLFGRHLTPAPPPCTCRRGATNPVSCLTMPEPRKLDEWEELQTRVCGPTILNLSAMIQRPSPSAFCVPPTPTLLSQRPPTPTGVMAED
jgi:hypothetical protein